MNRIYCSIRIWIFMNRVAPSSTPARSQGRQDQNLDFTKNGMTSLHPFWTIIVGCHFVRTFFFSCGSLVLLTREEQQQNSSSVKQRLISRVDCTPLRKGLNSFFEAFVSIVPATWEFWWCSWRAQGQVRGRLTWNLEVPFSAHISIYYFPLIKSLYPPIYPVRDIRSPATEMENLSFWGYCSTSA